MPWKILRSGLFDTDCPMPQTNHLPHITDVSFAKKKIILCNVKTTV